MLELNIKGELILSILNEVSFSAHLLLMLAVACVILFLKGVLKDL